MKGDERLVVVEDPAMIAYGRWFYSSDGLTVDGEMPHAPRLALKKI